MFEHWYVIDPGSYSIKFLDVRGKKRTAIRSSIAYRGEEVVAVSKESFQYIYEPANKVRIKGVFSHSQLLNPMIPLLKKGFALLESHRNIFKPGVILLTPTEFSDEDRDIWQNQMFDAGVQKVVFHTIMEALTLKDSGIVVHVGHTYTEIGMFNKGKLVSHKTIFFGGKQADEDIQKIVAQKTQCLISEEDACSLREKASEAYWAGSMKTVKCYGYNKYQQFVVLDVNPMEIWPAIENVIRQIALWTKDEFNKLDNTKKSSILQGGIFLSGGMAQCYGLQSILSTELHTSCKKLNQPSWAMVESVKGWK